MGKKQTHSEKGDTLVEVLLVTAIISMIVVGAYLLMNRAFGGTQAALEQTIVRQAIDGQVEMLNFTRDQYIDAPDSAAAGVWEAALSRASSTVSPFGSCDSSSSPRRFFLRMAGNNTPITLETSINPADSIAAPGNGVWLELYRPSPAVNYVDVHAYSCWAPPISGPNISTGTVVRLYVP